MGKIKRKRNPFNINIIQLSFVQSHHYFLSLTLSLHLHDVTMCGSLNHQNHFKMKTYTEYPLRIIIISFHVCVGKKFLPPSPLIMSFHPFFPSLFERRKDYISENEKRQKRKKGKRKKSRKDLRKWDLNWISCLYFVLQHVMVV